MRFASLGSGSEGNGLVVEADGTCVLIDCGFRVRDTVARLARLGLAPEAITAILVTHEHADHAGGVAAFAARYRIPVWLTILIISRDVGIVLTVAIVNLALGPRTFKPTLLGKGATALFIVTCVVVMYFNYLGRTSVVVETFIWASLAITLASGIDYVFRVAKLIE